MVSVDEKEVFQQTFKFNEGIELCGVNTGKTT
jgi:hypothetical protein